MLTLGMSKTLFLLNIAGWLQENLLEEEKKVAKKFIISGHQQIALNTSIFLEV